MDQNGDIPRRLPRRDHALGDTWFGHAGHVALHQALYVLVGVGQQPGITGRHHVLQPFGQGGQSEMRQVADIGHLQQREIRREELEGAGVRRHPRLVRPLQTFAQDEERLGRWTADHVHVGDDAAGCDEEAGAMAATVRVNDQNRAPIEQLDQRTLELHALRHGFFRHLRIVGQLRQCGLLVLRNGDQGAVLAGNQQAFLGNADVAFQELLELVGALL